LVIIANDLHVFVVDCVFEFWVYFILLLFGFFNLVVLSWLYHLFQFV